MGFPYSDSSSDPRLQRFRFIHTKRTFYNHAGAVTFTENGFLLSAFDRNAVRTLESSYDPKEMIEWKDDSKCAVATYCGFPMYRFDRGRYMKGTFDSPTLNPPKFTLNKAVRNSNNSSQVLVDFEIELNILTMIYLTPGQGWKFVEGSMPTSQRMWNGNPFRFSKITYGKSTDEALKETIIMEVRLFLAILFFLTKNYFLL